MSAITIEQARSIIAASLAKGLELGLKPLSVVVLDPGGHPIAFERQNGASSGRFAVTMGKASGALQLGVSSRKIGEMAAERPTFVASLAPLNVSIPAHTTIPVRPDSDATLAMSIVGLEVERDGVAFVVEAHL